MFGGGSVPEGLAEMMPGPELAVLLAGVDRDSLSGFDRVVVLQARTRQVAHDQAEFYADMAGVVDAEVNVLAVETDFVTAHECVAAEVRAALTLTRRSAEYQVGFASKLVEDYPTVWEALHNGTIDLPKAREIINQTCHLDSELAGQVADQALERAGSQTTGQLRARIQKLCFSVDPDSARNRYQEAVVERRVSVTANDTGTASIYGLDLPVHRANAAMRRVNQLARTLKTSEESRTMDQIRADVFLDLLNGHQVNGASQGTVDIRVDLATLSGLTDNPGELNGYGPVIADIARQVVTEQSTSKWQWTLTDNGTTVDRGTTHRRPTTSQKHQMQAQNPTCAFPGCRIPAIDCDLDHNQAWNQGGPTTITNLAPLCRHDHVIKHNGWQLKQTKPGHYIWTSPLGHTYTTGPDPP